MNSVLEVCSEFGTLCSSRFTIAIEMSVMLTPDALDRIISPSLKDFLVFVMSFPSVMKSHSVHLAVSFFFFSHQFTWLSVGLLNLKIMSLSSELFYGILKILISVLFWNTY